MATTRRPYHHGDLRRTLLDESLRLIEHDGPDALTIRAVARRAGVTHAAPYRHFPDKEALLAAVAEEGHRLMHGDLQEHLERGRPSDPERLEALGVAYVGFAVSHPSHFRVMFGGETPQAGEHPGLAEASEATFGLLLEVVEEGRRRGALRTEGTPLEMAIFAWSSFHGLACLLVEGRLAAKGLGSAEAPALAAAQARSLVRGLAL